MVEVGTGLALLGSAKLLEKLLGPTADYIGEGIKTWTEKKVKNVSNIFSIATKKLGDKIEDEGAVPPKVLKGILDEGSFCDDFLATEYFGGVLASSRSGISRDDRGASFIALVDRLTTYQIRTHYIFYHIVKNLFDGTSLERGMHEEKLIMETYVPIDTYAYAMEFDEKEKEKIDVLIGHIMFGLMREQLIEAFFAYGETKEIIQRYFEKATRPGIIFQPSFRGVELFFWAYGKPDLQIQDFFNTANQFEIDSKVNIISGYQKIKE